MPEKIAYRKGYKYQLAEDKEKAPGGWYRFQLSHEGIANHISTAWIRLDGRVLSIRVGFAWDGGSGPARDTKKAMPGFALHDALYQLTRLGYYKKSDADLELRARLRADGVGRFRAWYIYQAVRFGGRKAASLAGIRPVLYAP